MVGHYNPENPAHEASLAHLFSIALSEEKVTPDLKTPKWQELGF